MTISKLKSKLKCPLCEEQNMELRTNETSYVWSCSECPCIIMEYIDDKDLQFLNNILGRGDK